MQLLLCGMALWSGLIYLLSCASQTIPEERFTDSEQLSKPTVDVTLADSEKFTFAAVGDLHILGGNTTRFEKILDGAKNVGAQFLICLGDIADKGDRIEVLSYRAAIEEKNWAGKIFPVIGNHDVFGGGWAHFKELNGPSHYTFTIGNSKFIVIDTADGTVSESETAWFEQELQATRPKHLFVLSHYLPTVPGITTYLRISNESEATRLMKLAKEANVTAWLGAHYHSFVKGEAGGVTYVVAGGGGGRRMPPVSDYFYVRVTVSGDDISYEMETVE